MRKNAILFILIILLPVGFAAISTAPTVSVIQDVQYLPSEFTLQTFERNMNVTAYVTPDFVNETLTRFLYSAKESIYIEIYQFNSPAILSLINDIKNSNPSIDIKLMLSEHVVDGSSENIYTAWNLTQLGIPVRWTSDIFDFSHQKFIIIDNITTIVQAGNWAKLSVPLNDWIYQKYQNMYWKNYKANREFNIAMTDTEVTGYYRDVFDNDWSIGTEYNETIDGTGTVLEWGSLSFSYYPRVFNYSTEFTGDMKVTPIVSPDTSLEGILWCISSAKYTLDIEIPYTYNGTTAITQIVDAIIAAKERGVNVRIIADGTKEQNEELAPELAKHGIQMAWMDTRFFASIHNKAIIVDGQMILISSINWSETSVTANREAGVIIEHEGVAQWYQAVFDYDWGMASNEVSDGVNIGWEPVVPSSTDTINVSVYAHLVNGSENLDDVILSVKIDDGLWENHSILENIYLSGEVNYENYFYEISPQADGTNITVKAYIEVAGLWNSSMDTVIHVADISEEPVTPGVHIDSPSDVTYEYGDTGNSITWNPTSTNETDSYTITMNGTEVESGDWDGTAITIDVDGLSLGTYVYSLTVNDTLGNEASDTVNVFVVDTTNPTINSPNDITYVRGETGNSITWSPSDEFPSSYVIQRGGVEVDAGSWDGTSISWSVDGLEAGTYQFTLIVVDTSGNSNTDSVIVTVNPTQMDQLILYGVIAIGALVVVIIGVFSQKRK